MAISVVTFHCTQVGQINCNCRLSGMPDVTLTFNNPHVLDDARLHPSVRFARFAGDKALSFVPPDGEFTLMHYRCVLHVSMP